MVDGRTLVSYLETALAHSKVHGIHVDHPREWLVLCCLSHVRFLVLVDRYLNFYLATSPLSDGLYQATEARVRVDCLIKNKSGLRKLVKFSEVAFIFIHFLNEFLVVSQIDMVLSAEQANISCAN